MAELEVLHASSLDGNVIVVVKHGNRSLNGSISKEFLDDEVGDDADMDRRLAWIKANELQLVKAMVAKADGGFAKKPFDRIVFQGEG